MLSHNQNLYITQDGLLLEGFYRLFGCKYCGTIIIVESKSIHQHIL